MLIKWGIIFLCTLGLATAQEGYSRDRPSSQLEYNPFGEPILGDDYDSVTGDEIPGVAGVDYPVFAEVPLTRFSCSAQRYRGYYADPEAGCQVFHICQDGGRQDAFLCPNGTVFNQRYLVCDWWYNFECSTARSLYSVNADLVAAMEDADARLSYDRAASLRAGYRYRTGGYPGSGALGSFGQPSSTYGTPFNGGSGRFGSPSTSGRFNAPSSSYGAPSSGSSGRFNAPSSSYGAPSNGGSGRFSAPSSSYGVPSTSGSGRFSAPSSSYGAPSNGASGRFGIAPSSSYGAPSSGRFSSPSSTYRVPNGGSNRFSAPSARYGPPSGGTSGRFSGSSNVNGYQDRDSSRLLSNGGGDFGGNALGEEADTFSDRRYLPPSDELDSSSPDRTYLPPSK